MKHDSTAILWSTSLAARGIFRLGALPVTYCCYRENLRKLNYLLATVRLTARRRALWRLGHFCTRTYYHRGLETGVLQCVEPRDGPGPYRRDVRWTDRASGSQRQNKPDTMFRVVFWDTLPCKIIIDLWNVGRQLFYTAVYLRRQLWTSYSPPWELEISQTRHVCIGDSDDESVAYLSGAGFKFRLL
jgi:hypothetical protein